MNKLLFGLLAGCALFGLTGCGTVNEIVGKSFSAGPPFSLEEEDASLYKELLSTTAVRACIKQRRKSEERQNCRDEITYARMRYIDINYMNFRRKVLLEVNGGNAAADITVLGLNAAGTLVGGATTKAILAAISAGVVGSKGIIDKDVLYNTGIQTLILKMDADRIAVRLRVTRNLKQPEEVYPFEAAEVDAGDYYRAGTLTNALISLQGDAAAELKSDTHAINVDTPMAPAPPPLPLVAEPPPRASAPRAPRAVRPPPAPQPPSAADQNAFVAVLQSLKFDGKVLTPASRQVLDNCTKQFKIPAGTQPSDVVGRAGDNLNAITECIKRNRGGL
jgi:hypothetical protein